MPSLLDFLEESQRRGFIGPSAVEDHLRHAAAFAPLMPDGCAVALDLGAGGGLPGLALAAQFSPQHRYLLVDSSAKRVAFLREAVEALALAATVQVVAGRAERLAHEPSFRSSVDVVTARGFGPPAVTAECSAGFLRVGGALICSEPPFEDSSSMSRWKPEVAQLGLSIGSRVRSFGFGFQVLTQESECPPRFPRREGLPGKRPLFR